MGHTTAGASQGLGHEPWLLLELMPTGAVATERGSGGCVCVCSGACLHMCVHTCVSL